MEFKISELVEINPESIDKNYKSKKIRYLDTSNITKGKIDNIVDIEVKNAPSRAKRIVKNNDIVYSTVRPNLCHYGILRENTQNLIVSTGFVVLRCKEKVIPEYLYAYLTLSQITEKLHSIAETSTSAYPSIKPQDIGNLEINLPSIKEQEKIAKFLYDIEKKIELNNQINDNLSEQLKQVFNNNFFDKIQNNDCNEFKEYNLYDVLDVIDNRGKTPKLVEFSKYPIIDVRAISGENRIIDYKQCQKYVDEEVYNTFFRSGHPKINDILISTVGSLAEMKIYKENKGTIAQNVVALRCKDDYPMYIYQYLKAIKNDLISYNIGSVQPSIKVTQFMKHSIFIPKKNELYGFENMAQIYTDEMFNISKENETLEQLRDTLLPRLMNGEIDLDKIEI